MHVTTCVRNATLQIKTNATSKVKTYYATDIVHSKKQFYHVFEQMSDTCHLTVFVHKYHGDVGTYIISTSLNL